MQRLDDRSRMSGDVHVRFCESLRGRFPRATRLLLFSDSKSCLWNWKKQIMVYLRSLRLTVHAGASTVYPVSTGIPFLGFRLFADHRLLKRKNGINFSRRLNRLYREFERGELTFDELTKHVAGWIAHAAHGDTWGLRTSLLLKKILPISKRHERITSFCKKL